MHKLKLKILPNQYSIHRLKDKNVIASLLKRNNIFFSFTSTNEETSLICDSKIKILNSDKDDNWSCIQLIGQLKIEETGIWSRITTVCADSDCAVLTVTTFNTDYFLVKTSDLEKLKQNFLNNNFIFDK